MARATRSTGSSDSTDADRSKGKAATAAESAVAAASDRTARTKHVSTEVDCASPDDSVILATSERGRVAHDDRGQAQWKWVTETEAPAADPNADTFDFLKAVDSWELAIEHTQPVAVQEEPKVTGYNPYEKPR